MKRRRYSIIPYLLVLVACTALIASFAVPMRRTLNKRQEIVRENIDEIRNTDLYLEPSQTETAQTKYIIITATETLKEIVAESDFVEYRRQSFLVEVVSLEEIQLWCNNIGYIPEEVPIDLGTINIEYYVYKVYMSKLYFIDSLIVPDIMPYQLVYIPKREGNMSVIPSLIRKFLQYKYRTESLKYALFIGDFNYFPVVAVWDKIHSDLFYADMNAPWDRNGNGILAEVEEITGKTRFNSDGSIYDYLPEINVGRIPFNESTQIIQILNKIKSFEEDSDIWKNKALFLATSITFPKDSWYFAESGKRLWESFGYDATSMYANTSSIPLDTDRFLGTIVEPDYYLNDENKEEIWYSQANSNNPGEGYGLVMMYCHGTATEATGIIDVTGVEDNFSNSIKDSIVVSLGCNNCEPNEYNLSTVYNEEKKLICEALGKYWDGSESPWYYIYIPNKIQNLGKTFLKNGAVCFLGSMNVTSPGRMGISSYIISRYGINYLAEGNTIGDIVKYIINDYTDFTFRRNITIGYGPREWVRELACLDVFTIIIFGDPAMKLFNPNEDLEEK